MFSCDPQDQPKSIPFNILATSSIQIFVCVSPYTPTIQYLPAICELLINVKFPLKFVVLLKLIAQTRSLCLKEDLDPESVK